MDEEPLKWQIIVRLSPHNPVWLIDWFDLILTPSFTPWGVPRGFPGPGLLALGLLCLVRFLDQGPLHPHPPTHPPSNASSTCVLFYEVILSLFLKHRVWFLVLWVVSNSLPEKDISKETHCDPRRSQVNHTCPWMHPTALCLGISNAFRHMCQLYIRYANLTL